MQLIELSLGVPSHQNFLHFLRNSVTPVFPGFTVLVGSGYWQGKREDCAVVRIFAANKRDADYIAACKLAVVYCKSAKEDYVLVTVTAVKTAELIGANGEVTSL